jgi:hypothetical protein
MSEQLSLEGYGIFFSVIPQHEDDDDTDRSKHAKVDEIQSGNFHVMSPS